MYGEQRWKETRVKARQEKDKEKVSLGLPTQTGTVSQYPSQEEILPQSPFPASPTTLGDLRRALLYEFQVCCFYAGP
jgi:hypothetical protein